MLQLYNQYEMSDLKLTAKTDGQTLCHDFAPIVTHLTLNRLQRLMARCTKTHLEIVNELNVESVKELGSHDVELNLG